MKPLPHRYEVVLSGGTTGYAATSAKGSPNLASAPPPEFDGPGDAWSPEELLLAAVATCFMFTLRAVAQVSRVDFISLELTVEGTVDRRDGRMRFMEIVLRPRLQVPVGTEPERALRVLEKAEKSCIVSASLATPIRLEPEIAREP
ncbi:MAG TPA: OsmC family protein [Candidatus Deferrimicrobiaceae bacterium]|nr:OsmC family protein [Candidatus Deferrimicrobiaceae bacterium]